MSNTEQMVIVMQRELAETLANGDTLRQPVADARDRLRALLAQPAAQHQGEPVGWQFYQDGNWWNGDDRIKDHRKNTEVAGYPVREVFAHPDAGEVERLRAELAERERIFDMQEGKIDTLRAQLDEQDTLLRGLVEYADGLLADCNRAWDRAGRCAEDEVHEDLDYLKAVKLLSASAEPSESEILRRASTSGDKPSISMADMMARYAPVERDERAQLAELCDGKEQEAFEAWAKGVKYDMACHPLHWLFLDAKTHAARQGWAAGLEYATGVARAALERKP